MTLESQMAQRNSPKILSRKNYCTCGALKCIKPPKLCKISIFYGNMRPLIQWLRVDIERPNSQDTRESDGSIKFTKNLLKKYFLHLRRFKE
jgi:hypothetical protein